LKLSLSVCESASSGIESSITALIEGPEKTRLFDVLSEAQVKYETEKVWDPSYTKRR